MSGPGVDAVDVERLYRRLVPILGEPGSWGVDRARDGLFCPTLLLSWGGRRFVVQLPTDADPAPPGDRNRAHRVAAALWDGDVPVVRTVHALADPPASVTARTDGDVLRAGEPAAFATREHRRRLDERLVETLAAVHAADPPAWLPSPTPTERAERLRRVLAALRDRRDGPAPERAERVGDWLVREAPAPLAPAERTLVHGEFGLDNVALGRSPPPTVAAVLDWERARRGDPRADLARLVERRALAATDLALPPALVPSFPAREGYRDPDELARAYANRTGRAVDDLRYHRVLALSELAVDCAWLGWRADERSGHRAAVSGAAGEAVPALLERARRTTAGGT